METKNFPERDWKARAKSLVETDFFVDFDTPVTESTDTSASEWTELLEDAGELLKKLCVVTDNSDWDDGDGYWQAEYTDWCYRYLYYGRLQNIPELEKLCKRFSEILPNVAFYFDDDDIEEDEGVPVSEIGFVATRKD